LQAVASPLGHDAAISLKAPGEGVEPKPSPGSEPGVLPVRRTRTVYPGWPTFHVAPVPSQSSVSVSGGCLPAGSRVPNRRSIERRPPHALRHLCESSPAAPGLSRSAPERTRTSPRCSRPGRASTCRPSETTKGDPCGSPSSPVRCRISLWLGRLRPRDEDIRIGLIGNTRESMLSPDRLITPASY
jgi:hypothetical protein